MSLHGRARCVSVGEPDAVFSLWPPRVWRTGIDVKKALAIYALTVSVDSFGVATDERGLNPDALAQWWHRTLVGLLLMSS